MKYRRTVNIDFDTRCKKLETALKRFYAKYPELEKDSREQYEYMYENGIEHEDNAPPTDREAWTWRVWLCHDDGYFYFAWIEREPEETEPEQPETETAEADETETEPETAEPETAEPETAEQATPDGIAYEIRENSEYNSREVYFSGKPAAETREALKALKMRWHSVKKCWYGYATESAILAAIQSAELTANPEQGATVVTGGYMGGGAVYGAKSNRALYGKDLSAAIRADLKAAGIKGVTIACESYSGGQSIHATFTVERSDTSEAPTADPTRHYTCEFERILYRWNYWTVGGEQITLDRFQKMTEAEQTETALKYHAEQRERYAKKQSLNHYHMTQEENPELSAAFIAKVQKVLAIIGAYHYDASNSMVDYFETNFYYELHTKPGKSWTVQQDTTDIDRAKLSEAMTA